MIENNLEQNNLEKLNLPKGLTFDIDEAYEINGQQVEEGSRAPNIGKIVRKIKTISGTILPVGTYVSFGRRDETHHMLVYGSTLLEVPISYIEDVSE